MNKVEYNREFKINTNFILFYLCEEFLRLFKNYHIFIIANLLFNVQCIANILFQRIN